MNAQDIHLFPNHTEVWIWPGFSRADAHSNHLGVKKCEILKPPLMLREHKALTEARNPSAFSGIIICPLIWAERPLGRHLKPY
jgi:hypothetical protein